MVARGVSLLVVGVLLACGGQTREETPSHAGDAGAGGTGGTCASDSDGDGVCDQSDVCPIGDDTEDADGNGFPDACAELLATNSESFAEVLASSPRSLSLVLFYWDQEPSGSSQGECAGVRLGDSLLLAPAELGEFAFTAADEADFAAFVACITDGQDQWMSSGFDAGTTANADDGLETELWRGARDLSGVAVLYARLVVEEHTQMPTSEGTLLELSWRWELYGY